MRKVSILIAITTLMFFQIASAGTPWGWADYKIDVTLDESNNTLTGHQTVTYFNRSPETLTELYWNLFPNAANGSKTDLKRENCKERMYGLAFAEEDQLGYMIVSSGRIGEERVSLISEVGKPDVAKLSLSKPLLPGDSVVVEMDFTVKVPKDVMRMNRNENSYHISQWYPKLAVFDERGWHPYTYLEFGEFYAEFGNYDVTITVPERYVVASTGELQTESEIERIQNLSKEAEVTYQLPTHELKKVGADRSKKSKSEYDSSSTRTMRFVANSVVDFAWFAGDNYIVRTSTVTLPESGREVQCETYVETQNAYDWIDAQKNLESVIRRLSSKYGDYPYQKVAVVDQDKGNGGMEYPMITLIMSLPSRTILENVIAHEVAHNWFYAIVATDQRVWPWLDEVMAQTATLTYAQEEHPDGQNIFQGILADIGLDVQWDVVGPLMLKIGVEEGLVAPSTMHSEDYPSIVSYSTMIYTRGAMAMMYLREYVGAEKFDAAVRDYTQTYWMSHPDPDQLVASFESSLGQDLGWFFDGFLGRAVMPDFTIDAGKSVQNGQGWTTTVKVQDKAESSLPAWVRMVGEDGESEDLWIETSQFGTDVTVQTTFKPTNAIVDPEQLSCDVTRKNNYDSRPWQNPSMLHVPNGEYRNVYTSPYMKYEFTEGLILGGHISNKFIFPGHPSLDIYGGYGFVSGDGNLRAELSDTRLNDAQTVRYSWELRGQDWAGYRQLRLKSNVKFFSLYGENVMSHQLGVAGHVNHLADRSKFDPNLYAKGKHANGQVYYRFRQNGFLTKTDFKATYTQGLAINGGDDDYSKLDLNLQLKCRTGKKSDIRIRGYAGQILSDNVLPQQEFYYASGGVDPNYSDSHIFDRTGATWFSYSRNLVSGEGTNVRGYSGLYGDKAAYVASIESQNDGSGLFVDVGRFDTQQAEGKFEGSFGMFIGTDFVRLHVPLYISSPREGSKWVAHDNLRNRIMLSVNLRNIDLSFK